MKTAAYGRFALGAAAVLFGVLGLLWHDADTWQELHGILSLPLGWLVGDILMLAQIAGGILIMVPARERQGSTVLLAVYAIFSLAAIPGIIAAPKVFGQWDGFFEQFCLLCGALGVYAWTERDDVQEAKLMHVARIGLGLCTVSFMLAQAIYLQQTAQLVPKWIPPSPMFWTYFTTVAFGLAAIAMLLNFWARFAMRAMTLMLLLFGALVWIPLLVAHPEVHGSWSEFALTLLIAAAAWTVGDITPE
jgi:hypothetical protein